MAKLVFQSLVEKKVEECTGQISGQISLEGFSLLSITQLTGERGVRPAHLPLSSLAGAVKTHLERLAHDPLEFAETQERGPDSEWGS